MEKKKWVKPELKKGEISQTKIGFGTIEDGDGMS